MSAPKKQKPTPERASSPSEPTEPTPALGPTGVELDAQEVEDRAYLRDCVVWARNQHPDEEKAFRMGLEAFRAKVKREAHGQISERLDDLHRLLYDSHVFSGARAE